MAPTTPGSGGEDQRSLPSLAGAYRDKRVLVLGGDGFLGFHTTRALIEAGAQVSILTRRTKSLHSAKECRIIHADLADQASVEEALAGQEIVFDLAGSSGGVDSNRAPYQNLITDCAPHLRLFELAAGQKKPPLVVFCSTRTVYGRAASLPVSESHPIVPLSIYAAHKAVLERHLAILQRTQGLPSIVFRLSNPYGFYPWQDGRSYGVINQFIHRAFRGESLTIYGDGSQIRDYVHVADVVRTFLHAAIEENCRGEIFNLGGPEAISMREATAILQQLCPDISIEHCEWPADYEAIETGDYTSDLSKLQSVLGLIVTTTFRQGVRSTLEEYRKAAPPEQAAGRIGRAGSPVGLFRLNRKFWEGSRVLVTGASGFLGSHLAKRLAQRGAAVGAMHRRPLAPWLADDPQVWPIPLDLTDDKDRILQVFREFRPDYVYHFASEPDGTEDEEGICRRLDCNIGGTVNLLCGAQRYPVKGFILGDSCKVFGNGTVPHREFSATLPDSSYATSKLAAWHSCRVFMKAFGIPVAALRPTLIYGPGESFNLFSYLYQCLEQGQPEITLDGGQQTRDPLFISDAIHAYLRTVECLDAVAGRVLPIGGGLEQPVSRIAGQFLESGGCSTPVQCHPERIRATEMLRSFCDNAEAVYALEWKPLIERGEALGQTFRYHQSRSRGEGHAYLREWFDAGFAVFADCGAGQPAVTS